MQPYEIMTVLIAQCFGAYFCCFKIPAKPGGHCQHCSKIMCDRTHAIFPLKLQSMSYNERYSRGSRALYECLFPFKKRHPYDQVISSSNVPASSPLIHFFYNKAARIFHTRTISLYFVNLFETNKSRG